MPWSHSKPASPGKGLPQAVLAALLVVILAASVAWAGEVPTFHGYVNDYADMISPASETRLTQALQAFDLSDSTQIAILTVDSLQGEALEDFAIRVVDAWKIGQKGKDNGVLLLVAKAEREIRIEVVYGLEGVLTDLLSGRIIDTDISPRFKAGRVDEGFAAGVAAIMQATRGEFKADSRRRQGRGAKEPPPLFTYLFFGGAFIALLGSSSRKLGMLAGAILLPAAVFLGLPTALGWLVLLLLIPAGALGGLLLPLLLAGWLRGGGGFRSGSFGGGGFGGSGFGGFGGGGFGGGGASGGW